VYAVADDALNDHWDASFQKLFTSICGEIQLDFSAQSLRPLRLRGKPSGPT